MTEDMMDMINEALKRINNVEKGEEKMRKIKMSGMEFEVLENGYLKLVEEKGKVKGKSKLEWTVDTKGIEELKLDAQRKIKGETLLSKATRKQLIEELNKRTSITSILINYGNGAHIKTISGNIEVSGKSHIYVIKD